MQKRGGLKQKGEPLHPNGFVLLGVFLAVWKAVISIISIFHGFSSFAVRQIVFLCMMFFAFLMVSMPWTFCFRAETFPLPKLHALSPSLALLAIR
jgi:hypothetical protein